MTAKTTAVASPNHNARPEGVPVSVIVIHADASATASASVRWIRDKVSKVSYHTLVDRDGSIYRFVEPVRRAWHCGVSEYAGVGDVNDYSLGLCLSNKNDGIEPYTELQYQVGAAVAASWMREYPGITLERIVSHAEIALPKGRKSDPGPLFEWDKFRAYVQNTLDGITPAPDLTPDAE